MEAYDYNPATDTTLHTEQMVEFCLVGSQFLLDYCYLLEDKGTAIVAAI